MNTNYERFETILTDQYRQLFLLPDYAMAASRYTPEAMAAKFTAGLLDGSANHDGDGVKRACKALGLKPTRKAIVSYLKGES